MQLTISFSMARTAVVFSSILCVVNVLQDVALTVLDMQFSFHVLHVSDGRKTGARALHDVRIADEDGTVVRGGGEMASAENVCERDGEETDQKAQALKSTVKQAIT